MSPGCGLCHRKCVFFAGRSRPTTLHFSPSSKMLQFLARNLCSQILYIVIVKKPFWSLGDNEIRVVIVKYKSNIENDCDTVHARMMLMMAMMTRRIMSWRSGLVLALFPPPVTIHSPHCPPCIATKVPRIATYFHQKGGVLLYTFLCIAN